MKTIKTKIKKFDAVKMMRDIRDKISEETQDMSFEEFKKYMSQQSKKNKVVTESQLS